MNYVGPWMQVDTKDYMLELMFYKFLSDQTLKTFATTAGISKEEN